MMVKGPCRWRGGGLFYWLPRGEALAATTSGSKRLLTESSLLAKRRKSLSELHLRIVGAGVAWQTEMLLTWESGWLIIGAMNALDMAIEKAGGVCRLADQLGVGQSVVSNWRASGGRVPPKRVRAVEEITGISRHELRPDIFGPPPSSQSDAA